MESFSKKKLAFILFVIFFINIFVFIKKIYSQEIVDINANIVGCDLIVTVYPEKRIPVTNNWATSLTLELHKTSTHEYLGTVNALSNNSGIAIFNVCTDITPVDDYYDIYLRGKSHLLKNYGSYHLFDSLSSVIDLTSKGKLIAGETSIIYNNFINALDVSTQIAKLETNDNQNDLNQDGEVNVLDLSVTIDNYLVKGDCSPYEQNEGICI